MIVIESKKKHLETLKSQYGNDCVIIDVTSHVDDPRKPLSHASLVKAYIEGNFPE